MGPKHTGQEFVWRKRDNGPNGLLVPPKLVDLLEVLPDPRSPANGRLPMNARRRKGDVLVPRSRYYRAVGRRMQSTDVVFMPDEREARLGLRGGEREYIDEGVLRAGDDIPFPLPLSHPSKPLGESAETALTCWGVRGRRDVCERINEALSRAKHGDLAEGRGGGRS